MAYETLLFEVENQIATVTLHRPARMNAWNDTMAEELRLCMARCDEDDGDPRGRDHRFRARVLRRRRPRERRRHVARAMSMEQLAEQRRELSHKYDGYAGPFPFHIRKPVIAAINGHAIGVGITYAMTCDVRFVAEDAKIQFAFARRGVCPELWSSLIVPRIAGMSVAADLMLTGRMIDGASSRGSAWRAQRCRPARCCPRRRRGRARCCWPRRSRWRSPSGCCGAG